MIAKCKAIAHGSNALEYVFREGKLGRILALHNLCGETPKEIHEEMRLINNYNSRCKNKFLRIEIGIAPKDEPLMTFKTLNRLALLFAKQMGLDDHQWVNPELSYQADYKDSIDRTLKVIKGGSWKDIARYIRANNRTKAPQNAAHSYIGFRCVRSAVEFSK